RNRPGGRATHPLLSGGLTTIFSPCLRMVTMPHNLPPLPYAYDALQPHLDETTMRTHHDKHHAAYVNNLNAALEGQDELMALPIEKLIGDLGKVPEAKRTAVRNNGGGHANHTLFWEVMTPGGASAPEGELAGAIDAAFGSFDA